jgi:hypothetical protein
VINSAMVGTSQIAAMAISAMCTGEREMKATSRSLNVRGRAI